MPNYWMVRAGERGRLFDAFESRNIVGINFPLVGSVLGKDKDGIAEAIKRAYPGDTKQMAGKRAIVNGMHRMFCVDMSIDDGVATYNPDTREYLLGQITGHCQFQGSGDDCRHYRTVKWDKKVSRDSLPDGVKNSLGSASTVFSIQSDNWQKMDGQTSTGADTPSAQPERDAEESGSLVERDLEEQIRQRVEDRIVTLDWEQMEYLVAALLRAMGYRTKMTAKGADGGFDVDASPDGLMLKEPRIRVEVKHRDGKVSADKIRAFSSAKRGARGLYVSTGGFTADAIKEARREEITTLDLGELAEQVVEYYDNFDTEGRALLPMKKLYLPVGN